MMDMVGYSEGVISCKRLIATNLGYLIDELRGEGMVFSYSYRTGTVVEERKRLQLEALAFVTDESNCRWGFRWMCDILEVDYDWFLKEVKSGSFMKWPRLGERGYCNGYIMKAE